MILLDTGATAQSAEAAEQEQGMAAAWLEHGPVDELASAVADLIINEPEENKRWIAKWQARPKELMRHPAACLFGREDVSDRLAEITCPAIVVHGVDDVALSMEDAEALADGLPGAGPVVKVPGAHAANLTHPEPVNDALRGFLADLPA